MGIISAIIVFIVGIILTFVFSKIPYTAAWFEDLKAYLIILLLAVILWFVP